MDPVSVIGLSSAVASIVDVISKSIKSLHALHARWKETDLTITLLTAQLMSLKAALDQISQWIRGSLIASPQHHQLIIDLEGSLKCCDILIAFVDNHISKLEWNDANALTFESRLRVVLEDKATKDCLSHLNNQTNALNLLLTAFNCRTQSEQLELLVSRQSRRLFDQVKDDSTSLAVVPDSASDVTTCSMTTEKSSKLSKVFGFDRDLLESKVYQGTVRSLMRRAIHVGTEKGVESIRPQSMIQSLGRKESKRRSRQIDSLIAKDRKRIYQTVNLLLLGPPRSGKSTIIEAVQTLHMEKGGHDPSPLARRDSNPSIHEFEYAHYGSIIHLVDCTSPLPELSKLPHLFSSIQALVFVVDISTYDHPILDSSPLAADDDDDSKGVTLRDSMDLLHSISRLPSFHRKPILILLNKVDLFAKKLDTSPLQAYFPHYTGTGTDVVAALRYFAERFRRTCRTRDTEIYVRPIVAAMDGRGVEHAISISVENMVFKAQVAVEMHQRL